MMNRAQKRAAGIKTKTPTIRINPDQMAQIKADATATATRRAFFLMVAIPLMIMHDKHGYGAVRLEKMFDEITGLYESFEKGYLTIDDMKKTLLEETGFKWKD